jgi:ABC-2 type transport system ATP-binding protein
MPVPALALTALTKRYDNDFLALDAFDLEVPDGAFFGLLGPNGAGKTTLISAVCNLIRVTAGEIRVFGAPHDAMAARKMIGLAEQDVNLDRFLDVEETLLYHGGYYGMERARRARRAAEMMDVFDLRAKAHVRAPMLSGGMRRRLLLARALMHEPPLVILDEPTAGVDFELRLELWAYIRRPAQPRHDDPADDALPRGGRGALRGDRADPRRPAARARHGARACATRSPPTRSPTSTSRRWRRDRALAARHRGLLSLSARETHRVLKLWTQTVVAPILAQLLFILVFGLSLGARIRHIDGVPVPDVHRPGPHHDGDDPGDLREQLASVFQARFDRYLNDVPRRADAPWEINLALSLGGVVRALLHRRAGCCSASCRSSTCRSASRSSSWRRWRSRSCCSRRSA